MKENAMTRGSMKELILGPHDLLIEALVSRMRPSSSKASALPKEADRAGPRRLGREGWAERAGPRALGREGWAERVGSRRLGRNACHRAI